MRARGLGKEYAYYLNLLARLVDIMVLYGSAWIAYYARHKTSLTLDDNYTSAVFVQITLAAFLFPAYGVYQSWRGKKLITQILTLLKAWCLSFLILILIGALTKTSATFSREWLIYWGISSVVLLLVFKLIIYWLLKIIRTRGDNELRVIYVGFVESIKKVHQHLGSSGWAGFKSVAWVLVDDPDQDKVLPIEHVHGLNNLQQMLTDYRPDELWIVAPISDVEICNQVDDLLANNTVNIRYIPDISKIGLLNNPCYDFLGMLTWDISVTPFTEGSRLIKWLEDKLLGLFIFIVLTPLMLFIAIGIKLTSPGPVLFTQQRHGWDGKIFNIYKFRSMQLHQQQKGVIVQATKNDHRVTKFGTFLRCTNLDELPQFYNVIQGRMSIVGPRPHAVEHNYQYSKSIKEYMRRHKVKPGITGWAQVNGWRGETDTLEKMKNRVKYDFHYINNWSLWFDLKIILLTILRFFADKNAY